MRLYLLVGAQNDLAQLFVVAPGGQQVAQREKARIPLLIGRVEHLLEHLGAQQLAFLLVHQPEIGRNAERRRLFARKRQAQRVHGRDLRAVHEEQLSAQARVLRVFGGCLCQRRADALAHLSGSGVGKGHEQQPVDVNRVQRVGQAGEHPLNQHGGLARTGRRRHQQRAAPVFDRGLLVFCPLRHAHSPPTCCQNSSSVKCSSQRALSPAVSSKRQAARNSHQSQ